MTTEIEVDFFLPQHLHLKTLLLLPPKLRRKFINKVINYSLNPFIYLFYISDVLSNFEDNKKLKKEDIVMIFKKSIQKFKNSKFLGYFLLPFLSLLLDSNIYNEEEKLEHIRDIQFFLTLPFPGNLKFMQSLVMYESKFHATTSKTIIETMEKYFKQGNKRIANKKFLNFEISEIFSNNSWISVFQEIFLKNFSEFGLKKTFEILGIKTDNSEVFFKKNFVSNEIENKFVECLIAPEDFYTLDLGVFISENIDSYVELAKKEEISTEKAEDFILNNFMFEENLHQNENFYKEFEKYVPYFYENEQEVLNFKKFYFSYDDFERENLYINVFENTVLFLKGEKILFGESFEIEINSPSDLANFNLKKKSPYFLSKSQKIIENFIKKCYEMNFFPEIGEEIILKYLIENEIKRDQIFDFLELFNPKVYVPKKLIIFMSNLFLEKNQFLIEEFNEGKLKLKNISYEDDEIFGDTILFEDVKSRLCEIHSEKVDNKSLIRECFLSCEFLQKVFIQSI